MRRNGQPMSPHPAGFIDPAAPSLRGDPASRRVNTDPTSAAYQPPRWLGNRHLQTIWPVVIPRGPRVTYRRERWVTPDDDFIDLDWALAAPGFAPGSPLTPPRPTDRWSRSSMAWRAAPAATTRVP